MKKAKKYVYPVAFVIISFICLLATGFICNIFFHGDWSALAILFIAVAILASIILPIYCVKYSKIIQGEKFKVLFAIYNALVIVGSYMLPLIEFEETYGYGIIIFIWALFWSVLRLNFHTNTCENEEKLSKEKAHVTNLLLQNKKKNIVAICITCLYIITLAREPMVWQFYSISYILIFTLPLLSAFLFLVFLFSKNANYSLKSWLLPFALAGELIRGLFSICSSLSSMDMQLKHNPMFPVNFAFSCLMVILIAIMFIGTLFCFKYIKLLKYGALGYAILSVGLLIFNLINVGGPAYHQIDLNGTLAINTSLVIESLIRALYFIGIFIITTNKRKTDLV